MHMPSPYHPIHAPPGCRPVNSLPVRSTMVKHIPRPHALPAVVRAPRVAEQHERQATRALARYTLLTPYIPPFIPLHEKKKKKGLHATCISFALPAHHALVLHTALTLPHFFTMPHALQAAGMCHRSLPACSPVPSTHALPTSLPSYACHACLTHAPATFLPTFCLGHCLSKLPPSCHAYQLCWYFSCWVCYFLYMPTPHRTHGHSPFTALLSHAATPPATPIYTAPHASLLTLLFRLPTLRV